MYKSPKTNFSTLAAPTPTSSPSSTKASRAASDSPADKGKKNSSQWRYGSEGSHYFCKGHTIVTGVNDHEHDELCKDGNGSSSKRMSTVLAQKQRVTCTTTTRPPFRTSSRFKAETAAAGSTNIATS